MTRMSKFDLEERCIHFAGAVNQFISALPPKPQNIEYGKQLIRSSGSIGANYLEANEALGYKDFLMRIKIARKEAKETRYWLLLLLVKPEQDEAHRKLVTEATELIRILSSITNKASSGNTAAGKPALSPPSE